MSGEGSLLSNAGAVIPSEPTTGAGNVAPARSGDLIGLAERCEQETGADRDLDELIFDCAMFEDEEFARFTASIDAAMTLVPRGLELILKVRSGHWRAIVWPHGRTVGLDGNAPTAPRALCAAALRARASIANGGN